MLEAWTRKREVRDGQGHPTGLQESAIQRLFSRMGRMYLTKWTHSFKGDQDIKNWALEWSQEFVRHGIAPQMVMTAIERCVVEYVDWPPSLPQFIAMCRPKVDYEQAFHDAVRQMHKRQLADPADPDHWPMPAVYWAAVDFGQYELRQASYGQAAARWKRLLDKRMQDGCPAVPAYVPQLAAPARNAEGVAITAAEAKASALAAMSGLAGRASSRELAIRKARSILDRQAAGEAVTITQVNFAKEALARLRAEGDDAATEQESP